MSLEKTIEVIGTGLMIVGASGIPYLMYKIPKTIKLIRTDMTRLLDTFTAYAIPRISTQQEMYEMIELAKTRAKCGL